MSLSFFQHIFLQQARKGVSFSNMNASYDKNKMAINFFIFFILVELQGRFISKVQKVVERCEYI